MQGFCQGEEKYEAINYKDEIKIGRKEKRNSVISIFDKEILHDRASCA